MHCSTLLKMLTLSQKRANLKAQLDWALKSRNWSESVLEFALFGVQIGHNKEYPTQESNPYLDKE